MNGSTARGAGTLGIVGAGQLARMMAQAAIPLALDVRILATRADESAARIWPNVMLGSPDSLEALQELAAACDVLTFDHELIDPTHLAALESAGHRLRPSAAATAYARDKGYQRERFAALGLPVPPFRLVESLSDIAEFASVYGWSLAAKARRGGYDGRGVWRLGSPEAAEKLLAECRGAGVSLLVEPWLALDRELAVLVARRPGGEMRVYPVVETVQVEGICRIVRAPAPAPAGLAAAAARLAMQIATAIDATGILALELFQIGETLLINELALRPHNSGHYSIEGCVTSQFENHLRATLDLPLGSTRMVAPAAAMVNVLGVADGADPALVLADALAVESAHVHLYGKAAQPGRKLGHVTTLGQDADETLLRAQQAAAVFHRGTTNAGAATGGQEGADR